MENKLIFKQMSNVMRDIGSVAKNQKNVIQNFKFRGIDNFINALYPALIKHSVFMVPKCVNNVHELKEVQRKDGKLAVDKYVTLLMEYTFYAEDGSSIIIGPIPSEGIDSGDKATNKALSAALKYALIQTFSIPTEDMTDGDSESPEIELVGKQKDVLKDDVPPKKIPSWGNRRVKSSEDTENEIKKDETDLF